MIGHIPHNSIHLSSLKKGGYSYGFQGQEIDGEWRDGAVSFKYRVHDPRIGRFLSVDPLFAKYPYNSPYAFSENQVIAFVELEGLEKATPEQKQNAQNKIDEFANDNSTTSVFKNVDKEAFVKSLKEMVNNSSSIDQANTNLCGIATACKAAIDYNPEEFVKMAISIYTTGKYENNGLEVNALKRNGAGQTPLLDGSPSNGLDAASYVVMSSLRASLNNIYIYTPKLDNGLQGFTYPSDVEDILINGMGMKQTTDENWPTMFESGSYLVSGIQKAIDAEDIVILVVNKDQFMGNSSWSVLPTHYIQVTGVTENSDGTITVNWWSWGDEQTPIKMTKAQFASSTYFYDSYR